MFRFFIFIFSFLPLLSFGQEVPDVVVTTGHTDMIHAMAVSPDGNFMATSSNDRLLKVWDLRTGMEFRTIIDHSGRIIDLDFSTNGELLAGVSSNSELLIWDYLTGNVVYRGACNAMSQVHFFDDDKKVFFLGEDGFPYTLELNSGSPTLVEVNGFALRYGFDPKRSTLYLFTIKKELVQVNINTGEVGFRFAFPGTDLIPFTDLEVSADGRFIVGAFTDLKFRIFDTKSKKVTFVSEVQGTGVVDVSFDRELNQAYILKHEGDLIKFDCEKNTSESISVKKSEYDFGTAVATPHSEKNIMVFANYNRIIVYDTELRNPIREMASGTAELLDMAYGPNGRFLAVSTGSQKFMDIWDLRLNKIKGNIPAFFPVVFSKDGNHVIASDYPLGLSMFDVVTGKRIRSYNTGGQLVQCNAISPDGKILAAAGFSNEVYLWEVETGKSLGTLKGHTGGIMTLDFHPTKPLLASSGYDATLRIWDYEKKEELQALNNQTIRISEVDFSPDGKFLASSAWDQTIMVYSTATWEVTKTLRNDQTQLNQLAYSYDGKFLISVSAKDNEQSSRNRVVVWDVASEKEVCRFEDHNATIVGLASEWDAYRYFTASKDGRIHLNDFEKCEQVAAYLAFGGNDFMVYTPDNYYMTSSGTARSIAFRKGNELLPFEQFDLYLNRPDIVAERIGKSPDNLLKAYRYLYERKLKKLNLDEGSLELDYQLPKLEITSEYDLFTAEKSLALSISVEDEMHELDYIDVRVNGVPIFGRTGISVPPGNKSYEQKMDIPLIRGVNKIRIVAINDQGVKSLLRQVEVVRRGVEEKNDLYLLSIGVSDYSDSKYNLKYPRIDAVEMQEKFENEAKNYQNVYTKLLIDEAVTKASIISAGKALFQNCTYEDVAIIFIAGHGVLNESFDYYFATHDMDFSDPTTNGLPYDELAELLEMIKAYQKLLIMDTCHSGELDEEQYKKGEAVDSENGEIKFRAVGEALVNKDGIGFENMIKVTDGIFSYSEEGSGATIIASAGGAELAMESDEWKNGLFTFAFLEGLENLRANSNQNATIELSEIQGYVHKRVKELSQGMQIPTARSENISRDYSIFGVK